MSALSVSDATDGDLLAAIDALTRVNRDSPDASIEHRLVSLRNRAFEQLEPASAYATWPPQPSAPVDAPRG